MISSVKVINHAVVVPKKSTTSSFVCEILLKVSPSNEGVLLSRLEAARQMYNACLGQALRRVKLIRQSKDFNKARSLKPSNPERKVLFKRARERYDFSEYALHSYSTQIRHSWIGDQIDSNTAQKLATRAYKAVERVLFGQAKSVRFKGVNQMDSVEGKSNKSGIRWKGKGVEWSGLELPARIDSNDPVILHGLYKAFQKIFGKSVGKRAPGMFVSHLKSKAERAGLRVVEIPTYSTKLSQTCQCGRVKKKNLSERIHKCECGIVAQRDLYSAFLAKHTEPDTFVLQVSQLLADWQSAELRLQAAWRTATECNQPATGRVFPSSFGRCPEVERVATKVFATTSKNQNAVGVIRESGRGCPDKEPPGFNESNAFMR